MSLSALAEDITLHFSPEKTSLCEAAAKEGCVDEMLSTLMTAFDLSLLLSPPGRGQVPSQWISYLQEDELAKEKVMALMEVIVADESRHAALAWQTMEFCVESIDDQQKETLRLFLKKTIEEEFSKKVQGTKFSQGFMEVTTALVDALLLQHGLELQEGLITKEPSNFLELISVETQEGLPKLVEAAVRILDGERHWKEFELKKGF